MSRVQTGRPGSRRLGFAAFVLLGIVAFAPSAARAQVFVNGNNNRMTVEQFNSWLFQTHQNPETARTRFKEDLAIHTDDVKRIGELSAKQERKLHLAGAGDIKRFFDEYDVLLQKFQRMKGDRNQVQNQIIQDIQPLQRQIQRGLFGKKSFFDKSLRNTLTEPEHARYMAILKERRAFQHRTQIEMGITILEQGLALTHKQRDELTALLLSETRPSPHYAGTYNYYVVMYRMSKLDEKKLRPLFDDLQWEVVSQQIDRFQAMGAWLKQSGYLDEEEDEEDDAA